MQMYMATGTNQRSQSDTEMLWTYETNPLCHCWDTSILFMYDVRSTSRDKSYSPWSEHSKFAISGGRFVLRYGQAYEYEPFSAESRTWVLMRGEWKSDFSFIDKCGERTVCGTHTHVCGRRSSAIVCRCRLSDQWELSEGLFAFDPTELCDHPWQNTCRQMQQCMQSASILYD